MIRGSYYNGFAPRDGMPLYPSLWRGRTSGFAPCLGPSGAIVRDWTAFKNHGSLTNMDPATDWVVSGGRYCLDFDGTNDYISAPNSQAFASGTQLTASIWVKRNSAGVYAELINKFTGTVASNEEGWLLRWDNANKPLFTIAQSGSYGNYLATNANTTTDWTHLAVVHQFGTTSKTAIYVNGTAVAASWTGGTQVPDSDGTNYPIIVGGQRYQSASFNLWAGCVDDWAVYDRILNPNEITLLASRRGIAYDMMPMAMPYSEQAGFQAAWALRQRLILGGGGGLG